jgi:peptide methionine sulfoxide reductase msrA/msrB
MGNTLTTMLLLGAMTLPQPSQRMPLQRTALTTAEMRATFAGGCFWCMVPPYDKLEGVLSVVAGYAGGAKPRPTYEEVSTGRSGYLESVQIEYDPSKTTFQQLLDVYWKNIDPTDAGGQFADRGSQYHTAVFYHDEGQRREALASRDALSRSGRFDKPVVTDILPFTTFFPAEDYHQNYYKKNPTSYNAYKEGSGRASFLEQVWSKNASIYDNAPNASGVDNWTKPDNATLQKMLSKEQYDVTQCSATEAPFHNAYWDNHAAGIYVDIVSGEPLFSSTDKYDSGTGWPSFTKPIDSANIVEKEDRGLFMKRTEVRSKRSNSHLGHIFDDGPTPTGLRFCINSASLRFIPAKDIEREGYGQYKALFSDITQERK